MLMLEMWKYTLDKESYFSAIFMNLSKTFDTLNHNLLILKLGAYGFERDSLSFMKSYLNDRQQQVRVNKNVSPWQKIIAGVPQVSILGRLVLNIFINFLFLFVSGSNLNNYSDDNTLYASGLNLEEVKNCLSTDFMKIIWLSERRNVQTALIETFKIKKGFADRIMGSILEGKNNTYNVSYFKEFETERKELFILV